MRPVRGLLNHTFEYEAVGKDDPGYVELRIEFSFYAGSPESGRFGPPENYDPGSGHECEYISAERAEMNGGLVWVKLMPGEWLETHCKEWLYNLDGDDLVQGLPERENY